MELIVLPILILIIYYLFTLLYKPEIERQILLIESAFKDYKNLLDFSNGYFNANKIQNWKIKYDAILNKSFSIKLKFFSPTNKLRLNYLEIEKFNLISEEIRQKYNDNFLIAELEKYSEFFDNIEGRKLDLEQREAIIIDEDNNLVVAGAGSGKTTTIIGKVNYIIDKYNIKPENILLISFTKKSSETLSNRIGIKGINVFTFHKFGLDTISEVENIKPSLYDESKLQNDLRSILQDLLKDAQYKSRFVTFFIEYFKYAKPPENFKSKGEYIQHQKDIELREYNSTLSTFNGIQVRSFQECKIANFLFRNRIVYKYEMQYIFNTADRDRRQYIPDFTIFIDGNKNNINTDNLLFLEHFGINEKGEVPNWFAKSGQTHEQANIEYINKIKWARVTHNKFGTKLLETYSYEFNNQSIFKNLINKLVQNGLILNPMSDDEIINFIKTNLSKEYSSFIKLMMTFLALMKSNNLTNDEIRRKIPESKLSIMDIRASIFWYLFEPVYNKYNEMLISNNIIDFSDMINKATNYIRNDNIKYNYDYIIIDEFQDISFGRYQLIDAIKNKKDNCKLFSVGDDWQSIYRFTGSDIGLFNEFEKYFGISEISTIEKTYRFGNPLLEISNNFILKNPNQSQKLLRSFDERIKTKYKVIEEDTEIAGLIDLLKDLVDEYPDIDKKEILLLGRYNHDFEDINKSIAFKSTNNGDILYFSRGNVTLELKYMTVHKAKGLEADIVILINCKSGTYGFPSEVADDQILSLLLSKSDQFENSEERRLFYVALTRAKENVFLITKKHNISKFVKEFTAFNNKGIKYCPDCKTGILEYKKGNTNGRNWAFWGCNNYSYGCKYTSNI